MATILKETTALRGLRCRACAALQPADDRYVCGECLGPIEPEYDLSVFDTETFAPTSSADRRPSGATRRYSPYRLLRRTGRWVGRR